MKALFITFEGIDSSGKSTQILLLEEWFRSRGSACMVVREPGGTAISERIRELLLDPLLEEMAPGAELFLFSAARAQLTAQVILPALRGGTTVLCDRYADSTTAYQGSGRGIDRRGIDAVNRLATGACRPDITFYLDLDYDEAMRRKGLSRESMDRMEQSSREFYRRVRSGYLALAAEESDRFVVLNAVLDRDSIHREIVSRLEDRMIRMNNA